MKRDSLLFSEELNSPGIPVVLLLLALSELVLLYKYSAKNDIIIINNVVQILSC